MKTIAWKNMLTSQALKSLPESLLQEKGLWEKN